MTWSVAIIEVGVLPGCPLSGYLADAPEGSADLPCYCWLLRQGDTTVLVDSGPDVEASADIGYEVAGDTRAALERGLARAGVTPADVDVLVHTHLHQDHVQNDALFSRAEVVVQRLELETALDADAACASLASSEREELAAAPYSVSQQAGIWYIGTREVVAGWGALRRVEGDEEVAPALRVIWSGGHTSGHQSVVVETRAGEVCLTGDVVSLAANASRPGPMTPAVGEAEAFLDRAREAGWELIPAHEPALRSHRWYAGGS